MLDLHKRAILRFCGFDRVFLLVSSKSGIVLDGTGLCREIKQSLPSLVITPACDKSDIPDATDSCGIGFLQ